MSKMFKCPECGHEFGSLAGVCPKCGYRDQSMTVWMNPEYKILDGIVRVKER